jgi:hypothetical protein
MGTPFRNEHFEIVFEELDSDDKLDGRLSRKGFLSCVLEKQGPRLMLMRYFND